MAESSSAVIYHHPGCGTSRNVLELLRAAGYAPTVVEYLQTGWTRAQLLGLFAAAGVSARQALRVSKSPAEAMGLTDPAVTLAAGRRVMAWLKRKQVSGMVFSGRGLR